jgi:hypothetical protein
MGGRRATSGRSGQGDRARGLNLWANKIGQQGDLGRENYAG